MSRVAKLLLGLYGPISKDALVVTIRAYIDESSTHKDAASPMYMYCAVSTALKWKLFDKKWGNILRKNDLDYFHAEEVLGARKQFQGWSREDRIALCDALDETIEKYIQFGFCVVLAKHDFDKYRSGGQPLNSILESKWGLCFRYCLAFLHQVIPEMMNSKLPDVYIIYENGDPNCGSATTLHKRMQQQVPDCFIKSVAPLDKKDCYGVQAADLRAATRMHAALSGNDAYADLNSNEVANFAAGKRFPEFRIPLTAEVLLELRDSVILSKPSFVRAYAEYITPPNRPK